LASTGWGVVEKTDNRIIHLAHGCIETKSGGERTARLLLICTELKVVVDEWKPEICAVETLYFSRNVKSALPVAEARGAVCVTLASLGIGVREFTPNEIKKAVTGVANADKAQVQELVRIILGLTLVPHPDHAADALAGAICAANNCM
jgi:crossover junction endodeoxyribonuclease RuvC